MAVQVALSFRQLALWLERELEAPLVPPHHPEDMYQALGIPGVCLSPRIVVCCLGNTCTTYRSDGGRKGRQRVFILRPKGKIRKYDLCVLLSTNILLFC